jgi:lysozyme family protein
MDMKNIVGRKRKPEEGANAAAGSTSRNRSAKKSGAGAGATVSAAAATDDAEKEIKLRKFWSKIDTQVLWAWIVDYQIDVEVTLEAKAAAVSFAAVNRNNREALIDHLVTHRLLLIPPEGSPSIVGDEFNRAVATLTEVWAKVNAADSISLEKTKWPSVWKPLVEGKPTTLIRKSLDAAFNSPTMKKGKVAVTQPVEEEEWQIDDDDDYMDDQEEEEEVVVTTLQRTPAKSIKLLARSSPSSSNLLSECITCLHPRIIDSSSKMSWICSGCKLRGELHPTDPINIMLDKRASSSASNASTKASEEAAVLRGQLLTTESRFKDRLDKEFDRLTTEGEVFTEFIKNSSENSVAWTKEALKIQREQMDGTAYEFPSEHLIKLIRSGKLTSINYAVPHRFDAPITASSDPVAVSADGSIKLGYQKLKHEKLPSLEAFLQAVIGTILPAIIGQPHATAQWLGLIRSILHIDKVYGWSAAQSYLDSVLAENIRNREPISAIIPSVLESARNGSNRTNNKPIPPVDSPSTGNEERRGNNNNNNNKQKKRNNNNIYQSGSGQSQGRSIAGNAAPGSVNKNLKDRPCNEFNSARGCKRKEEDCFYGHFLYQRGPSSVATSTPHPFSSPTAPSSSPASRAGGGK